ncbi:hypothetical protein BJX70DRAFT_374296 [Aspergillus crustosus]
MKMLQDIHTKFCMVRTGSRNLRSLSWSGCHYLGLFPKLNLSDIYSPHLRSLSMGNL